MEEVGGWVGGWVGGKEAVRMRVLGGWVWKIGGEEGSRPLAAGNEFWVGGWVGGGGGWVGEVGTSMTCSPSLVSTI